MSELIVGATMQSGHRKSGVATDPANRHPDDWYATPAHAVRSLLEKEKFEGYIWEPACGDGAISKILKESGHEVFSTDLIDRGYGEGQEDFLTTGRGLFDNIITNPPYDKKILTPFIDKAVSLSLRKCALILRIQALEGKDRRRIYDRCPPSRIWVFSKRVQMMRGGIEPDGSSMVCYAWFVWDKYHEGKTELGWI